MKRSPRKRIYYRAGMISLVLLPLACFFCLSQRNAFEEIHVLSVVWPPQSGFWDEENQLDRKYIHFNLTGDKKQDQATIERSKAAVKTLWHSGDTLTGVHFHLGDKATFQEWVKVIDVCRLEKKKIFVPHKNDVWVFNPKPPKPEILEGPVFTCVYSNAPSPLEIEKGKARKRAELVRYIVSTAKYYIVPVLLFLLMTGLQVRRFYQMKRITAGT